jgi:hypothetical protein
MKKISGFAHIKAVPKYDDYELRMIHNIITSNTLKEKVDEIIRLYKEGKKEEADKLKSTLWLITPSGTFTERRASCLIDYSNYIVLDFDDVADVESLKEAVKKIPYTLMAFISPSGQGLKVIVEVDSDSTRHGEAFNQLQSYYSAITDYVIDSSGKDICRAMFLSHDPNAYWNENNEFFHVITDKEICQSIEDKFNNMLAYTETVNTYEEGNRNNFLYTLARNCKRIGIPEKDALALFLERFDLSDEETKSAVRSSYKCEIIKPLEDRRTATSAGLAGIANLRDLLPKNSPMIPKEVYDNLPDILKRAVAPLHDGRERDVFLTGALGVLSGCFPITGTYQYKETSPNLYAFVVAPPANGKGILTYCRVLGQKIHDKNKFVLDASKKGEKLFIPANASSAAVIKLLERYGGRGIIFETEADTLTNTLKQDWGGYSDVLRKAFHNEPITVARKEEDYEFTNPKLSVVLSGTPNQVTLLIPSAENGLFSRFLFYNYRSDVKWMDVLPGTDKTNSHDAIYKALSNDVYKIHKQMCDSTEDYTFELTKEQCDILNKKFSYWFQNVALYSDDAIGCVKRLGSILFRLCMQLSVFTHFEDATDETKIICQDKDFHVAEQLVETYFAHMVITLNTLPSKSAPVLSKTEDQLLGVLPDDVDFTRAEAVKIGKDKLEISERTVGDCLQKLVKKGSLIQKMNNKPYRKA